MGAILIRRGPQFTSWHISKVTERLSRAVRHTALCGAEMLIGPHTRATALEADGPIIGLRVCLACLRNQQKEAA